MADTPAGPIPPDPECGQMWMQDCSAREWGHVCILPEKHTIDHLCVCKARIGCVCICHDPEPTITSHVRPCCIDWVGGFWGKVGDAYPLIEARVRRDERARIVAELHAEGERERERLRKFKGLGPDVDPCHVSGELNNWITAWGAAAKFVQGEQPKPKPIIRNHPREAFPKETP